MLVEHKVNQSVLPVRVSEVAKCPDSRQNSGAQLFTALDIKSTDFWDATPCSMLKANRRFGGT
jgi:hypothetical protein